MITIDKLYNQFWPFFKALNLEMEDLQKMSKEELYRILPEIKGKGGSGEIKCPKCGKTTYIKIFYGGINVFSEKEKCRTCNGTGEIKCPKCKGKKELRCIEYNDIKDTDSFVALWFSLLLFVAILSLVPFVLFVFVLTSLGFSIVTSLYHIFNTYSKTCVCKKCSEKGKILCTKCNSKGYR